LKKANSGNLLKLNIGRMEKTLEDPKKISTKSKGGKKDRQYGI